MLERIFHDGQRCGEREELCPCAASLIRDCGLEPYEARVFLDGFEAGKRSLALPIEMACDHVSFVACLAAAASPQPIRE